MTPGWPAERVDLGVKAETIDTDDPRTGLVRAVSTDLRSRTRPLSFFRSLTTPTRTRTRTRARAHARQPKIPVQPISAADALPLLQHLQGEPAPKAWVGGLGGARGGCLLHTTRFLPPTSQNQPTTIYPPYLHTTCTTHQPDAGLYKLGKGPIIAHLDIVVENRQAPVWNVLAPIKGSVEPDRAVILGNHRDAWVYGAVDPNSGTAALLEIARALGEMLRTGWRPRRSIILASWDAEEHCLGMSTSVAL